MYNNFFSVLVRNILVLFALFSFIAAAVIFVTSLILISALRKVKKDSLYTFFCILYHNYVIIFQEHEKRIVPWLFSFAAFLVFRFIAWLFSSIANDPIFGYNFTMILLGAVFSVVNVYGWILVYSLYLELFDLTKLEDLAHLRVCHLSQLFITFRLTFIFYFRLELWPPWMRLPHIL